MATWRPEGWDTSSWDNDAYDPRECFEAGADAMVRAIYYEVEKIATPYDPHIHIRDREFGIGFESFRRKVLSLLGQVEE